MQIPSQIESIHTVNLTVFKDSFVVVRKRLLFGVPFYSLISACHRKMVYKHNNNNTNKKILV